MLLLRSVDLARALLLRALGVQPDDQVGLPANATRELTESVKHHPATPRFLALGADLGIEAAPEELGELRVVWAQPYGGASAPTWASLWSHGMRRWLEAVEREQSFLRSLASTGERPDHQEIRHHYRPAGEPVGWIRFVYRPIQPPSTRRIVPWT